MTRQLAVRPISELRDNSRMVEAGRIRIGAKVANKAANARSKDRPAALDKMRFTSIHRDLIEKLAEIYGGTPQAWNEPTANPPNQWQVITTSDRVRVVVPPGSYTQDYEAWSEGGCLRRCDGITCQMSVQTGDNQWELSDLPCKCAEQQVLLCKTKTRLTVMIPDIPFRGTWRLETSSEYAAREIPGMLDVMDAVSKASGYLVAELGLSQRKVIRPNPRTGVPETKRFTVPILTLTHTPEQIASGSGMLTGISASGVHHELPALPAPSSAPPAEDDIEDAEIVDDVILSPLMERCYAQADKFIVDRRALFDGMVAQAKGDLSRVEAGIVKMENDLLTPIGFADGFVQWAGVK